ncbi:MAG: alanine--tRNA ligase, partial [Candidatus Zixiibacteriota bacterium]
GQRHTDYKRATSSQKCIRAGGKHNDLDNVGFTARHHTFFEMLGNFSFGDYFKDEAIVYAWDWVTKDLGLPPDRLYATVYTEDDEAFDLWEKVAPALKNGRVLRFGKKDNYWSMGDIGPCGPCSEIHFDRGEKFGTGPDDIVNGETERFVEIWNLVFMQFDQLDGGKIVPLPSPSVDTGAGLERIAAVLQNVESNYQIDLFQNLISAISDITHSKYSDHVSSHHVIADHVRALTFAITDGAGISNEGRGYVLRRILRRAARHGRNLGAEEPFIYRLVPVLTGEMGDAYPELREKQDHVVAVIKAEEERFSQTLETGLDLFEKVAAKVKASGGNVIPGEEVFRLYDTYGFPYDLTELMAAEQSLVLDQDGFDKAMEAQKKRSRRGAAFDMTGSPELKRMLEGLEQAGLPDEPTRFVRREECMDMRLETESRGVAELRESEEESRVAVILKETPFYVEAGGQIDDTGEIIAGDTRMTVTSLINHLDQIVHLGYLDKGRSQDLRKGQRVTAVIDGRRRWDTMRNHTATHLAHAALRQVLGDHVKQSGSYVGPDRLRFDFSHHQPMTPDEISRVEEIVNSRILEGTAVGTKDMKVEDARAAGAMALFGEKYADVVRVVSVGGFSKELCGGTHVDDVTQIGPFFIVQETGIASGVRRLEAITGRAAQEYMLEAKKFRGMVSSLVGRPENEAMDGVRQLKETNTALQKDLKKTRAEMFANKGSGSVSQARIGIYTVVARDFGVCDPEHVGAWADQATKGNNASIAIGFFTVGDKRNVIIEASSAASTQGQFDSGAFARSVLPEFGGRGGGKKRFAQGSVATGTVWENFKPAVEKYVAEMEKD